MTATLLLDRAPWDLALTSGGDIAVAGEPYSQIQDVASACRLFLGELYYDTSQGIRYFQQILGRNVPLAFLKAQLVSASLEVPGVLTAQVFLSDVTNRGVSGQVHITTSAGPAVVSL